MTRNSQRKSRSKRRHAARRRGHRSPEGARRLRLETLETRRLLATIDVTTALDVVDPGDNVTSLREAVNIANSNDEADVIALGPNVYKLTKSGTGTLGDLDLVNDLAGPDLKIVGSGQDQTIILAEGLNERAFHVHSGAEVEFSDLTIRGARSSYNGAGIYNNRGNLTLDRVTLSDNHARKGGAIYSYSGTSETQGQGTVTIRNSTIKNNSSEEVGGGIVFDSMAQNEISNSTLTGNSTGTGGGALISYKGSLTIVGSTLYDNTGDRGGAIGNGTILSIVNSTISGNHADTGGAIRTWGGIVKVSNSTVTANEAEVAAGGMSISGTTVQLNNTILAGNVAPAGTNYQGTVSTNHSLVSGDPLLAPLGDYGGPTLTHAPYIGSPAINRGGDSGGFRTSRDQRGQSRSDGRPDIGAVETMPSNGNPLVVTQLGDPQGFDPSDGLTIRDAVTLASTQLGSDRITFDLPNPAQGEPSLLLDSELLVHDSLLIDGPGMDELSISGNFKTRILRTQPNARVTVRGLSLVNGRADRGAAIYNVSGEVEVRDVKFENNRASSRGGAIYTYSRSPAATGWGSITVVDSSLERNHASEVGGAIVFDSLAKSRIVDSTMSRNSTRDGSGGALASLQGTLEIEGSALLDNTSGAWGGAITNGTTARITNSTLSGNRAERGGAIRNYGGQLTITSSTIAFNVSDALGGGISTRSNMVDLRNTIVSNNLPVSSQVDGTLRSSAYNHIGADAKLAPLGDYGGPTATHALYVNSPAIDAGHAYGLTVDQRGEARTVDSPFVSEVADGTDIGAFEAGNASTSVIVVDQAHDDDDFDIFDGLTLREALLVAAIQPSVAKITFDLPDYSSIQLNAGELQITESVTIEGPGADLLSFDAGGTSRVMTIDQGATVNIQGLTIRGGRSAAGESGGGIYNLGTLNLTDSILTANHAVADGGAIFSTGNVSLTDVILTENEAGRDGGGIAVGGGQVAVAGTHLLANEAGRDGGGLAALSGSVVLTDSVIANNHATRSAGGTLAAPSSTLKVDGSVVIANRADSGSPDTSGTIQSSLNSVTSYQPTHAGSVLTVTQTADTDDKNAQNGLTLREAVNLANQRPGLDLINFDFGGNPTTIETTSIRISDALVIDGPGKEALTIKGVNAQASVFYAYENGLKVFNDLTVTGGSSHSGGGIYASYLDPKAALVLDRIIVDGNQAIYGGGVHATDKTVTILDSVIRNNDAERPSSAVQPTRGGGIILGRSRAFVARSSIESNSVTGSDARRAGIYLDESTLTMSDSVVSENTARGNKGGDRNMIGATGYAALGGGIFAEDSILTITGTQMSGNRAEGGQGGKGGDGQTGGSSHGFAAGYNGGLGGEASGAALYVESGVVHALDASIANTNVTVAGSGGQGGAGRSYTTTYEQAYTCWVIFTCYRTRSQSYIASSGSEGEEGSAGAVLEFGEEVTLLTSLPRIPSSGGSRTRGPIGNRPAPRPANRAPFVDQTWPVQVARVGDPLRFTFAADDFGDVDAGQTLSYQATLADDSPLPDWLQFNAQERSLAGTPEADNAGPLKVKITATDNGSPRLSTSGTVEIEVESLLPLQNPNNALDVNRDGSVAPSDVLTGINWLNQADQQPITLTQGQRPPSYDVNGDNKISPVDVLIVVNYLNSVSAGEGESEPTLLPVTQPGFGPSPSSISPASQSTTTFETAALGDAAIDELLSDIGDDALTGWSQPKLSGTTQAQYSPADNTAGKSSGQQRVDEAVADIFEYEEGPLLSW